MRMILSIVIALLALSGCGAPAGESAPQADSPPRESVFDPLTGTLDRAQAAEDVLLQSEQARRRQIEESEGL